MEVGNKFCDHLVCEKSAQETPPRKFGKCLFKTFASLAGP